MWEKAGYQLIRRVDEYVGERKRQSLDAIKHISKTATAYRSINSDAICFTRKRRKGGEAHYLQYRMKAFFQFGESSRARYARH